MEGTADFKFSFSPNGRMSRGPYIILSLIYFTVTLFVAAQMSLSAPMVIEKFLSHAQELQASAAAKSGLLTQITTATFTILP